MIKITLTRNGEIPLHCGDCPLFDIEYYRCYGFTENETYIKSDCPYEDDIPDNCPVQFEYKPD